MTLKYHPDKIRPDPSKNETLQTLNDYFVDITKAYKALTDEEIRNNYIQYGHPDGKQSSSIGIALPKFIITDGNGKYVLLVYAILLGVLLPYLVGVWWYGTQRMSKEKVLIESANNLFREYKEGITKGGILNALSTGIEFKNLLARKKSLDGLEKKIELKILRLDDQNEEGTSAIGLTPKDRIEIEAMNSGIRRKILGLLWAYLGRVDLNDTNLNRLKLEVAPIALSLNRSFTTISFAFGLTAPVLNSYYVAQNLIQAVPPCGPPLLQLPHFTPKIVKAIEGESTSHFTIQDYMKLPRLYRRKISIGKGLLTESQYKVAVSVARQLPQLQVEKAFFKVTGENFVTPNSVVTLVVKGRIIPPGSLNIPKVNIDDLIDVDPYEDDLDAIPGRKKNVKSIEVDGKRSKPIQPPLAYAPYFVRDYSPKWHVFLADNNHGKIVVPPVTFATFDKPIYDENEKPTFNIQTLKAQFQAPPQTGNYNFIMHLVCDSYIGFDEKMEVTLCVEDSSKAVKIEIEDDISEPDEGRFSQALLNAKTNEITDSIAGQMQALKSGGISSSSAKKKLLSKDSSDDESDTDGDKCDDAEDTSETNTDTETE